MTSLPSPRYTFSVSENQGRDNLHFEGRKTDKSYLVAADTGASVTIARPDITAELPERDLTTPQVLQMASAHLKEALAQLILPLRALTTWLIVASITDEFILGLDVMRAHNASVDFGRRVLQVVN
jgi:hypothetical protein